jgi:L-rhamnonate dehydratase
MTSPKADEVVPQFYPLLINEPIPINGKLKVGDEPGFGVELNRDSLIEVKKNGRL